MTSPILIYSRDIGGTNQMVEVHRLLTARQGRALTVPAPLQAMIADIDPQSRAELVVVAKDQALAHWRALGVAVRAWTDLSTNDAGENALAEAWLDAVKPSAVLTATTDVDDSNDLFLWRAARRRKLFAAAFVDHRINLSGRFFTAAGELLFPDAIFVIDEGARAEIAAAGVPAERIHVAGDLHLARLAHNAPTERSPMVRALRRTWGVDDGEPAVLYISECLREMRERGSPRAPYDEIDTLVALMASFARGEDPSGLGINARRATVVVRPHPKDRPGKFDAFVSAVAPRVIVSKEGLATDAILAADAILGLDSTMLYEAQALGRPVASLAPESIFARLARAAAEPS